MTATPSGIAAYGWDFTRTEGLAQWVNYEGTLGSRWTFPGNVGVAGLGAHSDASVTLAFSIFGPATLYGRKLSGPPVADHSVEGLLVAARVNPNGTARWLRIVAEGAGRASAAVGLVTAPDGSGGLFWNRAPHGVSNGGLLLWDTQTNSEGIGELQHEARRGWDERHETPGGKSKFKDETGRLIAVG